MSKIKNSKRLIPPHRLRLPLPIRAVAGGRPVMVVSVGGRGCRCECDHESVGLLQISDLWDLEPLTLWLSVVERRARRTRRLIELPHPVSGVERAGGHAPVTLTGVRSNGTWLGYDECGGTVRVRLPGIEVAGTTASYLAGIRGLTRGRAGRRAPGGDPCTKA